MKRLLLFFTSAILLAACSSTDKKSTETTDTMTVDTSLAVSVGTLMEMVSGNTGEEVIIEGIVTHVCIHSGKRCFLKAYDSDNSIRVEAKGNIGGFNSELNGTRMAVRGTIRENRLSEAYINEWEQKTLNQKEQAELDENTCSAELANIKEMRDWMLANNKDFYSIYYIEGLDYKVLN
ncbi:MAG: hypothetical protein R6U66_04150 [Bacteroidales bacterium]|jgi:opacity protein-like surface antigen